MKIPVDKVVPNPEQPRQTFSEESLQELATSIEAVGVIQPITVELSPDGETYILHDGERRWRAAQLAGLRQIPAEVLVDVAIAPVDRLARALVANVQREDLTPLEIARAYARLHDECGLTDQTIADQVGRSRSAVANSRRLLELPPDVQELANVEGVSERQVAALLPLYQQLPKRLLTKAEKSWNKPSELIEAIRSGQANSDNIRVRVARLMQYNTEDLGDVLFPLDHPFEAEGLKVRSPRCDVCAARVKVEKELRCPDEACLRRKKEHWQATQLQMASEALDISLGGDAEYGEIEYFYGEGELLEKIRADGCQNLVLTWSNYTSSGHPASPDFPNVQICCHHEGDRSCNCLRKLKAERTRNDPERIAEREREKAIQHLIDTCGATVAAAIEEGNTQIWERIYRGLNYHYSDKQGRSLEDIQLAIGRLLVKNSITYQGNQDAAIARREVSELLKSFDLKPTGIEESPVEKLRIRLDRVRGWLDGADREALPIEAILGNIGNVERIANAFDDISEQLNAAEREAFLGDIADLWEQLDALRSERLDGHQLPASSANGRERQAAEVTNA